jgi:hypothetical protein
LRSLPKDLVTKGDPRAVPSLGLNKFASDFLISSDKQVMKEQVGRAQAELRAKSGRDGQNILGVAYAFNSEIRHAL